MASALMQAEIRFEALIYGAEAAQILADDLLREYHNSDHKG